MDETLNIRESGLRPHTLDVIPETLDVVDIAQDRVVKAWRQPHPVKILARVSEIPEVNVGIDDGQSCHP
jgi:hypothetical protein